VPAGPVSGHWTVGSSPYRVTGDIEVRKSTTLTIDPGVRVEFEGSYSLRVFGGIHAVGTAAQRIVFTTSPADLARGDAWAGWRGIRIPNNDYQTNVIDHGDRLYDLRFCEIAYVDKRDGVQAHPWDDAIGAMYVHGTTNADLVFDDNWIHHSRSGGLAYFGAQASVLTGPVYFHRNVIEHIVDSPAIYVAHVYGTAPPGTADHNLAVHVVGGAARHFIGPRTSDSVSTVGATWDTPVYLDNFEITDCGDQAHWYLAWQPQLGAVIHRTTP